MKIADTVYNVFLPLTDTFYIFKSLAIYKITLKT